MSIDPPYEQYGDQSYSFGLPEEVLTLIPGMAVTSLKPSEEPEFTSNADGPTGLSPAVAVGDDMQVLEGSGYLLSVTAFKANKTFTYEGRFHIILKRGREYVHNGFAKCDFSTKSWSLITS